MPTDEALISVDIEASGPTPSTGSMVSIGACLVDDPSTAVYIELKPLTDRPWTDETARVHGLDRTKLERDGLDPRRAMERLADWLAEAGRGRQPVFAAFNAPFDWMFVADYFHRFLGRNPFGASALDIKAYYMGSERVPRWSETTHRHVKQRLGVDAAHTHNALDDAREQAQLIRLLLAGREEPVRGT
jgi:DNA polymerase III epsilon subunit-like protein